MVMEFHAFASTNGEFGAAFRALTGHEAYPWQKRLFLDWFMAGRVPNSISLPTGTGKTSIMALWLLARGSGAPLPRRLVWVVDRRVVVDQATREAENLLETLGNPELAGIRRSLVDLSVESEGNKAPIAVSTLRGEHEDNREWSKDPTRPAIIVGTVDMVGSRLLFSGYGDGRWHRPYHAGLLAVDTLLVLDEAQLSTPFEAIAREIERLQERRSVALPSFHFLPISATLRSDSTFGLESTDQGESVAISKILRAAKCARWHGSYEAPLPPEEFVQKIVQQALEHGAQGGRVVVYLDRLKYVARVARELEKHNNSKVVMLTGTMRGHERDLLLSDAVFNRFLHRSDSGQGQAYLVSTSAGEVGIDLYSDHAVCDLVAADRMIQRLGRVNRAGDGRATIDIVVKEIEKAKPSSGGKRDEAREARRGAIDHAVLETERYLRGLPGLSPAELDERPPPSAAFTPPPPYPPLRSWLLDAWSLTSEPHPDLPVDAWLRGSEAAAPDVYFAWREEVELLADPSLLDPEDVEAILGEYRLLPREVLRNDEGAARAHLLTFAKTKRTATFPVVVLSPSGEVEYRGPLGRLLTEDGKSVRRDILRPYRTFLLPVRVGGLDARGMLDPAVTQPATDVSGTTTVPGERRGRGELVETEEGFEFRPIGGGTSLLGTTRDEVLRKASGVADLPRWRSFPLKRRQDTDQRRELVYLKAKRDPGSQADPREMLLEKHLEETGANAEAISRKLGLDPLLAEQVVVAARWHDRGKARAIWQDYAGNADATRPLAKSTRYRRADALGGYRHELGSVVEMEPGFKGLARHLVAAHHGYGRPNFTDRMMDREHYRESRRRSDLLIREFAALQHEFGWWGLAYLESLVKAADGMASP
jgi:CRISPR-associated endonuclease/helicase Cas3